MAWGAQNIYHEEFGAYTGENSATTLSSMGGQYVLVGHSERRQKFGETDADVNAKIKMALNAKLVPVLCLGELLEERQAHQTQKVLQRQLAQALAGIESKSHFVLAYEPVWAIGTGLTASAQEITDAHQTLRQTLQDLGHLPSISILYGGSVKPENAAQILQTPGVDGLLVGGASLKAESLHALCPKI